MNEVEEVTRVAKVGFSDFLAFLALFLIIFKLIGMFFKSIAKKKKIVANKDERKEKESEISIKKDQ